MAHLSHFAEKKILECVLKNTSITSFTPYLGMYSAAPTDAGGGTELTGTNGYIRQSVSAASATDNGASSGSQITTSGLILFPAQTPGVYVPVAWGIFDASSSGNMWWWELFSFPTYNIGDQIQFPIGNLTFSLD